MFSSLTFNHKEKNPRAASRPGINHIFPSVQIPGSPRSPDSVTHPDPKSSSLIASDDDLMSSSTRWKESLTSKSGKQDIQQAIERIRQVSCEQIPPRQPKSPKESFSVRTLCSPSRSSPARILSRVSSMHETCNASEWRFGGVVYDPTMTRFYAATDGCIPSNVKLLSDNVSSTRSFLIPWRYTHNRTGEVTWRVIHMTGEQIVDAESETLVVDLQRDHRLVSTIQYAKTNYARHKEGEPLVEFLLQLVRRIFGDYGIPGGPSSSEADLSLFRQLRERNDNFMPLCQVRIGLCRHKALLFKLLCDAVRLDCALVTGYSTAGRHQWNIVSFGEDSFLIDPTSPLFSWAKRGSFRTKAYRISEKNSFGHGGLTWKEQGIL